MIDMADMDLPEQEIGLSFMIFTIRFFIEPLHKSGGKSMITNFTIQRQSNTQLEKIISDCFQLCAQYEFFGRVNHIITISLLQDINTEIAWYTSCQIQEEKEK